EGQPPTDDFLSLLELPDSASLGQEIDIRCAGDVLRGIIADYINGLKEWEQRIIRDYGLRYERVKAGDGGADLSEARPLADELLGQEGIFHENPAGEGRKRPPLSALAKEVGREVATLRDVLSTARQEIQRRYYEAMHQLDA